MGQQPVKSDRHICFHQQFEYYKDCYGCVWRALISAEFYGNSYRLGRMVAKQYEADDYLKRKGLE